MAKPKTKQPAVGRQRDWFWRHKILLALLVIVLGVAAWWRIDDVVRQRRSEREQAKERATFAAIQKDIYALGDSMANLGEVKKDSYCYYTSNTTPWEKGDRYCNVLAELDATKFSKEEAHSVSEQVDKLIKKQVTNTSEESLSSENNIFNEVFTLKNVRCVWTVDYYQSDTIQAQSLQKRMVDSSGNVTHGELVCSKPAQAEYYHLVK